MCPITASAKKALRQSQTRRQKNQQRKNKLKNLVKKFRALAAEKKTEEAKKLLPQVYKALDKTAKIGVIKKNTASRKKSRLAKLISRSANLKTS